MLYNGTGGDGGVYPGLAGLDSGTQPVQQAPLRGLGPSLIPPGASLEPGSGRGGGSSVPYTAGVADSSGSISDYKGLVEAKLGFTSLEAEAGLL